MNKNKTIKAISLFCGCGGSDLGLLGGFSFLGKKYSSAGIDIIHASDINPKAVATYNQNFKHKAVVEDINNLSFKKGSADVVVGGFPCQSFSTVNPTKRPESRENQLFWQMAKIIDQVRPKVFIAENVKGFYRLNKGKYFELAKNEFESLGYNVSHSLIDASGFGVPQRRERLFMVGVRSNNNGNGAHFTFPRPSHGHSSEQKRPKVALKAVIDSLMPPHPKYYFSRKAVEGVKRAKTNMKRALAQNLDEQCLTITSHLAKVSLNSRDPVLLVNKKKEIYRRFTPREAARIQSFPDDFVFAGSDADAYRQIGNAIPPVVMWYMAKEVVRQFFAED